jgi:hypothetical protein
MGNQEWGMGKRSLTIKIFPYYLVSLVSFVPTPHSLFPTPHFQVSANQESYLCYAMTIACFLPMPYAQS